MEMGPGPVQSLDLSLKLGVKSYPGNGMFAVPL